ncbi:MAG: tetratricopeptide repeat protein [Candidatus Zhuqueibacterota bacterium]
MRSKYFIFLLIFIILFSCSKSKKAFDEAKSINTVEAFTNFLSEFPEGKYAIAARNEIARINFESIKDTFDLKLYKNFITENEGTIWTDSAKLKIEKYEFNLLEANPNIDTLKNFISKNPQHSYLSQAKELLDFSLARKTNSITSYQGFLEKNPSGKYSNKAQEKLYDVSYQKAKADTSFEYPENEFFTRASKENSVASFDLYLKRYPNGQNIDEAKNKMEKIRIEESAKKNEITKSYNTIVSILNYLDRNKPAIYSNMGFDAMMAQTDRYHNLYQTQKEEIDKNYFELINQMNPDHQKNASVRLFAWQKYKTLWFRFHTRHLSGLVTHIEMEYIKNDVFDEFLKIETSSSVRKISVPITKKYGQIVDLFKNGEGRPSVTENSITIGNKTIYTDR